MEKNAGFVDAESYVPAGFEGLTFKMIVMLHIQRISVLASKEMRGGYWEDKVVSVKGGQGSMMTRVYIPDTRAVYDNAIKYLADVLCPHFDETMREEEEKILEEINKLFNQFKLEFDQANDHDVKTYLRDQYNYDRNTKYRKLFRELCNFLYRIKYLELGVAEE